VTRVPVTTSETDDEIAFQIRQGRWPYEMKFDNIFCRNFKVPDDSVMRNRLLKRIRRMTKALGWKIYLYEDGMHMLYARGSTIAL
jgi:hypothetical protein